MPLLLQQKDRYLHCPRLALTPRVAAAGVAQTDVRPELSLIAWYPEQQAERVLRVALSATGDVQGEHAEAPKPEIVTLTRGDAVAASDDCEDELREQRDDERVWASHEAGVGSVWLRRGQAAPVLVFRAHGSVAAPTLCPTCDGTWVSFHHNLREDTHEADVAKWIALRFVATGGEVFEPSAPMRERDRDRGGVEQSFEFPALALGPDGALSIFGRGSHNFWRQDLTAAGFGPRIALSDGEWGSRGRHIAALSVVAGVLVARRERKGIQVDLLALPAGGAPELKPTQADLAVDARASTQIQRDELRAADPARAYGCSTLFGDIQQHSAHSDGVGSADEVYLRARHRYGDDFVALTDHEAFLGKRTGPGEWAYLQRVAERYDAPGEFATLYAYEWTGKAYPGPGHKCVYYPEPGLPIVSRDEVPEGKDLVFAVQRLGGFASPHHIGWTGADEPGHDDEGQPLWEICSCHGCYEHEDHPLGQRGELKDQMADTMLKKGHRFGFTASSDSHGLLWHPGAARKRDPYRTGLTAVQAESVTREAIMQALVKRRCYATSGAKILLDVRADGQPMGSELSVSAASFEVRAVGTARLVALELVGERGVIARVSPLSHEGTLSARLESPFVYARVVQEDGEMAWSSPVFLGQKRAAESVSCG